MSEPASKPARPGVLATTAASVLVAYGVFLRWVFPNADPVHPTWYGWMLDEGRWTELAREWALFRAPDIDTGVSVMHLLVAPIYQLFSAFAFEVLGVGFSSARIVSRVAGVLLVLLICIRLRRVLPPLAWVVTVGLVAVHPELVYFSRVAIPEMVALLFQTSAFLVLVLGPRSVGRAATAGVLTALGLGAKATTAPVALAFAVIILVVHSGEDLGSRVSRLGAFVLGMVGPGLLLLAPVVMLVGSPREVVAGAGGIDQILGFIELKSVPQIVATPFGGAGAAAVNTLLVALWPVAIAAWLRRTTSPLKAPLFLGSIIWAAGWMLPWALLSYFPERYVTHLYVPLILAIGSGLSALEDGERRSLGEVFDRLTPVRRLALGGLVAVPLAVVAAPALLSLLHPLGLGLDRIRYQALFVLGLTIAAAAFLASRARSVSLRATIIAFPLSAVLTWRLAHGPIPGQFWRVGTEELLLWAAIIVVACCLTWGIGRMSRGTQWEGQPLSYSAAYAVALCFVWSITDHAPAVTESRYVLPTIAAEIAARYDSPLHIGVAKSASALIETPFRHKEVFGPDDMPEVVLAASWGEILSQDPADLQPHRLVKEFEMPRFEYRGMSSPMPTYIRLYELSRPTQSQPDDDPGAAERPSGSDPR